MKSIALILSFLVCSVAFAETEQSAKDRLEDFLASDADFIILATFPGFPSLCNIGESECVPAREESLIGSYGYYRSSVTELDRDQREAWGGSRAMGLQEVAVRGHERYLRVVNSSGRTNWLLDRTVAKDVMEVITSSPWESIPMGLYRMEDGTLAFWFSNESDGFLFPRTIVDQIEFLQNVAPGTPTLTGLFEYVGQQATSFTYDDFDELGIIQSRGLSRPLGMRAEIQRGEVQFFIEAFYSVDSRRPSEPNMISIRTDDLSFDLTDLSRVPGVMRNDFGHSLQYYVQSPIDRQTAEALSEATGQIRVRVRTDEGNLDFNDQTHYYYGFNLVYRYVQLIEPYL